MIVTTASIALWLWMSGKIGVGAVAMTLPLAYQIASMAGWVAQNVTGIFENVGTVLDGMKSIAVPRSMPDRPDAVPLHVGRGEIRFDQLHFGYGTERGVLHGIAGHRRRRVGWWDDRAAKDSTSTTHAVLPSRARCDYDRVRTRGCPREFAQIAMVARHLAAPSADCR